MNKNLFRTEEQNDEAANATEKFLTNIIATEELGNLPCSKCDGDCCGAIPIKIKDLNHIFEKYTSSKVPKEIKKEFQSRFGSGRVISDKLLTFNAIFGAASNKEETVVVPKFQKASQYLKIGLSKESCIFKRSENVGDQHCMVYEDRPLICRAYGYKSCPCPYDGLQEKPQVKEVKDQLVNSCHAQRQSIMMKTMLKEFK